jgi:hypothetical protein
LAFAVGALAGYTLARISSALSSQIPTSIPYPVSTPIPAIGGSGTTTGIPALPGHTITPPPPPSISTGSTVPPPAIPTTFVTPAQTITSSDSTIFQRTSQASQATGVAKWLKRALVTALGVPSKSLKNSTIGVGILANGDWIAALNQGRDAGTESALEQIVNNAKLSNLGSGRYLGPFDGDPIVRGGDHAEKFILQEVTSNNLPLEGLGASIDICPFCQADWLQAGWSEDIFGNPAP